MGESPVELSIEIRGELESLVQQGVQAIRAAVAEASRELREVHIPAEAPQGQTGALASDWLEREISPLERVVYPGDTAWYAHIVARGRGEVTGRALPIPDVGFRTHAGPTAPDPFDERAIAALEGRLDELLEAALTDQGV